MLIQAEHQTNHRNINKQQTKQASYRNQRSNTDRQLDNQQSASQLDRPSNRPDPPQLQPMKPNSDYATH